MTDSQFEELTALFLRIAANHQQSVTPRPQRSRDLSTDYRDLEVARLIAAQQSAQTGKNYQNFTSGRYDHAFGVRTALAAIRAERNRYAQEGPPLAR